VAVPVREAAPTGKKAAASRQLVLKAEERWKRRGKKREGRQERSKDARHPYALNCALPLLLDCCLPVAARIAAAWSTRSALVQLAFEFATETGLHPCSCV